MNPTPQDLTFFKGLSQTETGRYLADFLKRVIDHAHDSRGWKEGDTKESAAQAARLIKTEILDRFRPEGDKKPAVNQFE